MSRTSDFDGISGAVARIRDKKKKKIKRGAL